MDELICQEKRESSEFLSSLPMPEEADILELAQFFRIFGDSTRIRILYALSRSELCVCELAELLNATQSAVSHQLQILRAHRLVKYRREGRSIVYSLDDEHIFSIIAQGLEHIKE